ncbi:MAG: nicotinate-nicotinamide nucleotide adenylyltransferase, partial [Armatimonadetes bacterium]|nr:nicotinate-nicotinamide nucleotide adenylyltransferase [Armatimonadota bacterium]
MERVGIMGGTFDPIHYGHLVTAEEARVQFELTQVLFVPNRYPPHKRVEHVTDPEHRYSMTQLAVRSNERFSVSRVEIDRPGPSYTIDTILAMRKESAELLGLCQFIAASRPGFPLNAAEMRKKNATGRRLDSIHVMEIPALAISSTDIRRRVGEERPIRYLVPDPVEA